MAVSMIKKILLCSVLTLSACGDDGTFGDTEGTPGDDTDEGSSTVSTELYLGDDDDMNNLVYDEANDELVINNLPFDGVDGRYVNVGTSALGDFQVYASQADDETGHVQYYAVHAQSEYGRAGAAGTAHYADYGHGGAMIARNSANVELPVGRGELLYTGSYAGVRVTAEEVAAGGSSITLSDGDVQVYVDLLDFDVTGAVHGSISGRNQYSPDGTLIGTLEGIVLNETTAISSDGSFSGTAGTRDGVEELQSGTYTAVFAGPNGEEIIGAVRITGNVDNDNTDLGTVQETGVFIAAD